MGKTVVTKCAQQFRHGSSRGQCQRLRHKSPASVSSDRPFSCCWPKSVNNLRAFNSWTTRESTRRFIFGGQVMMDTAILVCDPHRNFLSCSVQTPYSGHFTTSAGNCMRLCRNMTMMACSVVHLTRKKTDRHLRHCLTNTAKRMTYIDTRPARPSSSLRYQTNHKALGLCLCFGLFLDLLYQLLFISVRPLCFCAMANGAAVTGL